MGASFEWVEGWLARMGPEHYADGDPYEASAVAVPDRGFKSVTVKGLSGNTSPRVLAQALDEFAEIYGIPLANWERKKGGMVRRIHRRNKVNTAIEEAANGRDYTQVAFTRGKGGKVYSLTQHTLFTDDEDEANADSMNFVTQMVEWAKGKFAAAGKPLPGSAIGSGGSGS